MMTISNEKLFRKYSRRHAERREGSMRTDHDPLILVRIISLPLLSLNSHHTYLCTAESIKHCDIMLSVSNHPGFEVSCICLSELSLIDCRRLSSDLTGQISVYLLTPVLEQRLICPR